MLSFLFFYVFVFWAAGERAVSGPSGQYMAIYALRAITPFQNKNTPCRAIIAGKV